MSVERGSCFNPNNASWNVCCLLDCCLKWMAEILMIKSVIIVIPV